jgi:hypothetical protein
MTIPRNSPFSTTDGANDVTGFSVPQGTNLFPSNIYFPLPPNHLRSYSTSEVFMTVKISIMILVIGLYRLVGVLPTFRINLQPPSSEYKRA